jgi:hypothetical protein
MAMTTTTSRADRELERTSRQFRAGQIGAADLERAAARIEAMAGEAEGEADRIEIAAAARVVRDLPRTVEEEAVYGPLQSSKLVRDVERIVTWAWEELPTTRQRVERVRAALKRIDLLPPGSVQESHVVRTQRTDLLDLLAALEAQRP